MRRRRIPLIAAIVVATYALLVIPGFIWPAWFETPAFILVLLPILSVYFFHKLGVPGLLEHNGQCGWGMCSPTALGWVFMVVFWLGATWLLAWAIAAAMDRIAARRATPLL